MFRAVWFLIQVGLVVGLAIFLSEQQGEVSVQFQGRDLKIEMGYFLLGFMGVILVALFLHNLIQVFVSAPVRYQRYRAVKAREKGYKALTLGLTAVAAGDKKVAIKQARRTAKLLPEDTGLPRLLQAQAARLQGKPEEASKHFAAMLENKDSAFLGVRGLLQAALDSEDYGRALDLARTALKTHPKQPWILKTVYDLEIKRQDWPAALETLKRVEKAGAIARGKAVLDRAVICLAEGEERLEAGYIQQALELFKKAHRGAPEFVPAAVRLAKLCKQDGKRRAAQAAVKKTWKLQPHPELLAVWMDLIAPSKASKGTEIEKWKKALVGNSLFESDDKRWVCSQTGRAYPEWHWFAMPHGAFNTMVWDVPQAGNVDMLSDAPLKTVLQVDAG